MNGGVFSMISNASKAAVRLIPDVKNSGRNVNGTTTNDVSTASAVAMRESGLPDHSSSSSMTGEHRSNARPSNQIIEAAAINPVEKEAEDSPETQYPTILDANLVEDDTRVIPSANIIGGDYFLRLRQIALMAAHASPATGKIIAGHAQTVVKSVVVVAKSAVDSVEATKTAIRTRHEARAKVRLNFKMFQHSSFI